MAKKKAAKQRTQESIQKPRIDRVFDHIEAEVTARSIPDALGIIRALRYVALELNEMNLAASELTTIAEDVEHIKGDLEYLKNAED